VRPILVVAMLAGIAPGAAAQASIFSARGLGLPGRFASPHSWAMGGSIGLFDPESNQNPASLVRLTTLTAGFQLEPEWRHTKDPAGTASVRQTQFPLFALGGPLRGTRLALGVSFGNYTSRDFELVSSHPESIRGVPVNVTDSLTSRGGMNDIGIAASYALGDAVAIGAAVHVITGVNRMNQSRVFADTSYLPAHQQSELSFAGYGFSLGASVRLAPNLQMAALLRSDSKAAVDRDSTRAYTVDLPYTVAAGLQFRVSPRLLTAGQATYKTWSGANSDLLAQGGSGARNTVELNGGFEWTSDPRRPWHRPLRLGVRYAQLPFLLSNTGDQPSEFGVSLGSGARFAGQRGGIDVAIERNWRKAGTGYSETGWMLVLGISVRPVLNQQATTGHYGN
jgi:hypothetical protein